MMCAGCGMKVVITNYLCICIFHQKKMCAGYGIKVIIISIMFCYIRFHKNSNANVKYSFAQVEAKYHKSFRFCNYLGRCAPSFTFKLK